ncbi:MAG TPA: aminotransferase class I/II-fold pyridoxal phosphate-dependent enzyme [Acidimicrobiales bacterium]|nr:aminotransferase class I/II-fold pyridoxal phosphate-dependent enzyme [Acidimicrobiales bacterium]
MTEPGFDDLDIDELRKRHTAKWAEHPAPVLPAWVAEMDFPIAAPIRDALIRTAEAADLGYPFDAGPDRLEVLGADRMAARFGWRPDPDLGFKITDVMRAVIHGIVAFAEPGEGVAVVTPIYPPFLGAIADNHRVIVEAPLRSIDEHSSLNIDALAAAARRSRVLLWCHPHNPSGRSFTLSELAAVAAIVEEHDLIVVSDEIHADLTFPGHEHIPLASLSARVEARTFTVTSPSKAFNLAGAKCAVAYCGSEALLDRYRQSFNPALPGITVFGIAATRAAWTEGDEWLARCVGYLDGNRQWFASAVSECLPAMRHRMPDATYLAWLDARGLAFECPPGQHFLERGGVALSDGAAFGAVGEGFVRVNLATSRAILEQVVDRMVSCAPPARPTRPARP